jgi:hypothetical protein
LKGDIREIEGEQKGELKGETRDLTVNFQVT